LEVVHTLRKEIWNSLSKRKLGGHINLEFLACRKTLTLARVRLRRRPGIKEI